MKIIDEVYPLIKCEARLSDDGTLWIKTDTKSAEQTKRVLIEYAENSFCKTFYQDCDEPPTIPMFAESEEAYKAWTGEEMGGGRLIDADKLKKQLDTVYNEMANERERKGLRLARWFLISAPTVSATKKLNNQIHLCDSCKYNYPNCPSENEDVLFGNGVGNDNICCCAKYLASADRPHGEHGEWEHTEEVTTMDGLHWHVWRCTNCNSSGNPDMNYCPNCGAKMGGDGE